MQKDEEKLNQLLGALGIKDSKRNKILHSFKTNSRITLTNLSINNEVANELASIAVTELNLESNNITADGARALFNSSSIASLNLNNNNITAAGTKPFINNTSIETLELDWNNICDEGTINLAKNRHVTSLSLCSNNIGTAGIKALAENKSIAKLTLSRNNIFDDNIEALATNTSITHLTICDNNIGNNGVKALAKNTSIIALNLEGNNIGDDGAKPLAENSSITTLNLSGNNISDAGVIELASNIFITDLNLSNNKITGLDLIKTLIIPWSNNKSISADGIKALAMNKHITKLNLSNNDIGNIISLFANNSSVTELDVSGNKIGNLGTKALAGNTVIATLNLSSNNVGNSGTKELAKNPSIIKLDLSSNNITDLGAKALVLSESIAELNIDDNYISCELTDSLKLAIAKNKQTWKLHTAKSAEELLCLLEADSNIDINKQHPSGRTPLHFACIDNDLSRVQLLLQKGGDLNIKDINDKTPVDYLHKNSLEKLIKTISISQPQIQLDYYNKKILVKVIKSIAKQNDKARFIPLKLTSYNAKLLDELFNRKILIKHGINIPERIKDICQGSLQTLTTLILQKCNINSIYLFEQMHSTLKSLNNLINLDLSNNKITSSGLNLLYSALTKNSRNLAHLDLRNNLIHESKQDVIENKFLMKFDENLAGNCEINFSGNCIKAHDLDKELVHKNNKITLLFSNMQGKSTKDDMQMDKVDSVILPNEVITNWDWALAIASHKKENHTIMYLEGLNNGQRFFDKYDFVAPDNSSPPGTCLIKTEKEAAKSFDLFIQKNNKDYNFKTEKINYIDGYALQRNIISQTIRLYDKDTEASCFSNMLSSIHKKDISTLKYALAMLEDTAERWSKTTANWIKPTKPFIARWLMMKI